MHALCVLRRRVYLVVYHTGMQTSAHGGTPNALTNENKACVWRDAAHNGRSQVRPVRRLHSMLLEGVQLLLRQRCGLAGLLPRHGCACHGCQLAAVALQPKRM